MNDNTYDPKQKRVLEEVKKILDELFPHKLGWPICYIHKTEMCQVIKKGENTYYQCFETGCTHKEYDV